jgi:hypothetical protein
LGRANGCHFASESLSSRFGKRILLGAILPVHEGAMDARGEAIASQILAQSRLASRHRRLTGHMRQEI